MFSEHFFCKAQTVFSSRSQWIADARCISWVATFSVVGIQKLAGFFDGALARMQKRSRNMQFSDLDLLYSHAIQQSHIASRFSARTLYFIHRRVQEHTLWCLQTQHTHTGPLDIVMYCVSVSRMPVSLFSIVHFPFWRCRAYVSPDEWHWWSFLYCIWQWHGT